MILRSSFVEVRDGTDPCPFFKELDGNGHLLMDCYLLRFVTKSLWQNRETPLLCKMDRNNWPRRLERHGWYLGCLAPRMVLFVLLPWIGVLNTWECFRRVSSGYNVYLTTGFRACVCRFRGHCLSSDASGSEPWVWMCVAGASVLVSVTGSALDGLLWVCKVMYLVLGNLFWKNRFGFTRFILLLDETNLNVIRTVGRLTAGSKVQGRDSVGISLLCGLQLLFRWTLIRVMLRIG